MRERRLAYLRMILLGVVAVGGLITGITWVAAIAVREAGGKRAPLDSADGLQCAQWAVIRAAQLVGIPIDRSEAQRLLPYNVRGHNMLQISGALKSLGIDTVGRRDDLESLGGGGYPCIIHLTKPDHFVVVSHADEDWIDIYDGAGRCTVVSTSRLLPRFGGEVLYAHRTPISGNDAKKLTPVVPGPRADFETLLVDKDLWL